MAARRARRGRDRPVDGQSRRADAEAHRRQAGRSLAAHGHARLLGLEGHPAPATRDLRLVPAPLRRRARSGRRGDRHHRLEGRPRAPDARVPRARRHRAGAESLVPDPHLRRDHRRRRHPLGAHDAGRRFLRRARARDPRAHAQAEDADARLPVEPDRAVRRSGVLRTGDRARARQHDILVVHDLAYADIVFDGYQAPSIMQVPGARDVAVEFFTMSKSYNMAGWRIGFMVGNKELVHALARIKSYHDYGSFTPIQVASIVALEGPQDCVEEIRKTLREAAQRDGQGAARHRLDGRDAEGLDVHLGEDPRVLRQASARSSSPSACSRRRRSRSRPASASATTATTTCASR